MSQKLVSAYSGLAQLLTQTGQLISPAELQGILLGRSCAGASLEKDCLSDIAVFFEKDNFTEQLKQAILGLQAMVGQELKSNEMAITLLLPSDDESLTERLNALIHWCEGFLAGFGLVEQKEILQHECLMILQDISSMALIDTNIAQGDEARSERDYMELVEYLRVIPVSLYADLNEPKAAETTLH